MTSEDIFKLAHLTHRHHHLTFRCSHHGTLRHVVIHSRHGERVRVLIDVHQLISPEVDRIRKEGPSAAKKLGMIDLQRERFPTPGGTSRKQARPWLTDHPEML